MKPIGRAILVTAAGAVLFLLSACSTSQGEVYTRSDAYEKHQVAVGTFHRDGLAWEYRVDGVRVDRSVQYEVRLTNLSEKTLRNLRSYPDLPGWEGSPYLAGTMTPGRAVRMRWEWAGDTLPSSIRLVWDGGSAVIQVRA